jgi:hypothetical protein
MRETASQFGLAEIQDPRVTAYQSREDYQKKTGHEAPAYNPSVPNKHWSFTDPTTARSVTVRVVDVIDGEPRVVVLTVPMAYAQWVNISPGGTNAAPADSSQEWIGLPIQLLRVDEYLALTFGGLIVVRNRTRFAEPVSDFEERVIGLLGAIAGKLGIAVGLWLVLALSIGGLMAQTQVKDAQVAPPPTQFTAIQVVTPQGKVLVQPHASIQIDLLAVPPVIRAVIPPPVPGPVETADRFIVPEAGQTVFPLSASPVSGTLVKVFKNGILQWPDVDYEVSGQTVTILPLQGTAPSDKIQILYWR